MNPIEFAIKAVGGGAAAAEVCGVSSMAISKWKRRGCLPRTEYTGKTKYAEVLAEKSDGAFTAKWLLEKANPDQAVPYLPL